MMGSCVLLNVVLSKIDTGTKENPCRSLQGSSLKKPASVQSKREIMYDKKGKKKNRIKPGAVLLPDTTPPLDCPGLYMAARENIRSCNDAIKQEEREKTSSLTARGN